MDIQAEIQRMGRQARAAAHELNKLSTDEKNAILHAMADEIVSRIPEIIAGERQGPLRGTRSRPFLVDD